MTDSEISRNPESWMLDFSKAPKWNYCHGLVLSAIQQTYEKTGDTKYYDYIKSYADTMIIEDGDVIRTYDPAGYNIDMINSGKFLFALYQESGDEKYRNALALLFEQMKTHPRTSEGGFWHKKIYPYQLWLDGVYMASPFLAQYGKTFHEPQLLDEVAHQVTLVAKRTYSPETGLYYHGWDEKRAQLWADPKTGLSPNFWSRSMGWFAMALVDVLDFLPEDQPERPEIITIAQNLAAALEKYRDAETGMWYQVTDKGGEEGNYLESTGSIMFIYFWAKGAQKGYLDESYLEKSQVAYDQFVQQFITENPDGTINVTNCCSVAGLGGKDNRDGSFQYYISEPVRDNDPKATGPFIMASILLDK
jgi:unsaturated rhamnogalacturonyl hydrolase